MNATMRVCGWLVGGTLSVGGCGGDDASMGDTSTGSSSSGSSSGTTAVADSSSGGTTMVSPTTGGSSSTGESSGTTEATGSSGSSGDATTSGTDGTSSSGGSTSGGVIGESSSGGIDPSIGFIVDPDLGGAFECDPWTQNCPEGQKCMPWANDGGNSWNATICSPLDPNPNGVGEVCNVEGSGVSGIDDCELGAVCWGVDTETNTGTCVAQCTGSVADPSCPAPTDTCVVANEGALNLCLPGCDPLAQTCPMGEECIFVSDGFTCAPDASGGAGFQGDDCAYVNACAPGLACVSPDLVPGCVAFLGCCTTFCDVADLGASADCAMEAGDGAECLPWYAEGTAPAGLENIGFCGLP